MNDDAKVWFWFAAILVAICALVAKKMARESTLVFFHSNVDQFFTVIALIYWWIVIIVVSNSETNPVGFEKNQVMNSIKFGVFSLVINFYPMAWSILSNRKQPWFIPFSMAGKLLFFPFALIGYSFIILGKLEGSSIFSGRGKDQTEGDYLRGLESKRKISEALISFGSSLSSNTGLALDESTNYSDTGIAKFINYLRLRECNISGDDYHTEEDDHAEI
jgi:hypothetical protein